MIEHLDIEIGDGSFHVARTGSGAPLLLLHGWPEFSLAWEPVMRRLASRYTLIAPDLRGFGDSCKPHGPYGPDGHARDMQALLSVLGIERAGIVGHDVGGAAMLPLARQAPERIAGLFFFDFTYPGIGARMGTPDRLAEIWYQSFHLLDIAPALVGATRDTCRAYIGHFLRHWAHRADAHDDVLEAYVENFLKPGNREGGFAHYRASNAGRIAMMTGEASSLSPIAVPTCVRWAAHDPLFPPAWTDRLGETFTDLDLEILPGVGHFPHREDPDLAAREIDAFFTRLGWA